MITFSKKHLVIINNIILIFFLDVISDSKTYVLFHFILNFTQK